MNDIVWPPVPLYQIVILSVFFLVQALHNFYFVGSLVDLWVDFIVIAVNQRVEIESRETLCSMLEAHRYLFRIWFKSRLMCFASGQDEICYIIFISFLGKARNRYLGRSICLSLLAGSLRFLSVKWNLIEKWPELAHWSDVCDGWLIDRIYVNDNLMEKNLWPFSLIFFFIKLLNACSSQFTIRCEFNIDNPMPNKSFEYTNTHIHTLVIAIINFSWTCVGN